MLEMGLVVAFGLIFTLVKLNWRAKMWMFSNPVLMDVIVFVLLTALHWGTFTGVMVATIGAFVCSLTLSAGRKLYGYVEDGHYHRGMFDVLEKLR